MKTEEAVSKRSRKVWLFLFIPLAFISIASAAISLREFFTMGDIEIKVSEDDDELEITAQFPKEKTKALHDYLRSQINLSDLTNLNEVVIKKYQTPDDEMTIYLKSRPGYIKIVLDKHMNGKEAYQKLKIVSEGIKQVFTSPTLTTMLLDQVRSSNRVYAYINLHELLLVQ
jgi:hypothetical protein